MAIQWMDNFAAYGAGHQALMLNGPYAEVYGQLVVDPDPNAANSVVYAAYGQFGAGESTSLRKVLPASAVTVGAAFRLWLSNLPANVSQSKAITIADGANNILAYLYVTTTGGIQVKSAGGAVLAASAGPVIVANAWQHIEFKTHIDAAAGTVEVRVEGVTVLTAAGLNTGVGPAAQVRVDNYSDGGGGGVIGFIKDLIIWDGSGAQNTDFLGSCSVVALRTSSDVSLNWTPSAGLTGWNLLNETPPDDDAGYIQAPTPAPAAAVFGMTDLPADVTSVKGLMSLIRSKKTDGGDGNLQVSLVSGASTSNGADRPLTTAYTYWNDLFPQDPVTAAAWLPAAVNAANLKLNRTL